jgi:hypothetical protein
MLCARNKFGLSEVQLELGFKIKSEFVFCEKVRQSASTGQKVKQPRLISSLIYLPLTSEIYADALSVYLVLDSGFSPE